MFNHQRPGQISLIKAIIFVLALIPFNYLAIAAFNNDLGPDPVEFVQRWTGIWTINLLLLTLCISPLRAITQWHWILRLRRTLGLFTFFYSTLHFLTFIVFDHALNLSAIASDILKRPYVTLGFAAFAILITLAATSNQFAIRQLGGRRWQDLHRSIYLIAILGCLHYFWLTKTENLMWPLAYSIIFGLLLRWRINERKRKAIPAHKTPETKPLHFFKQKPD